MLGIVRRTLACLIFLSAAPIWSGNIFVYSVPPGSITSAAFEADFAALTAHRYVAGTEVNFVRLLVPGFQPLDLSAALFGTSDLALGQPAALDMGPLETRVFSVPIPSSFFPALSGGAVGYSILFTDTGDGLFAMDFLGLKVSTTGGSVEALIDTNDGFKVGIPDNGTLSAPLPLSITVGATGTGFDEAISSKALEARVPEPATFFAGAVTALLLLRRLRRRLPLALLVLAMSSVGFAKKVVCVSDGNDGFLNNHEGFERQNLGANDVVIKGGNLVDCLAMVADGDTLVIIAHGFAGGFFWGDTEYTGFGTGEGDAPLPNGFNNRKNITIKFCSCHSAQAPEEGKSILDKLKMAVMSTTAATTGFVDLAQSSNRFCLKGGTQAQIDAAKKCLMDDRSWEDNPPANRPNTGGANQPDNQLSAAQKIVNNCVGAGGKVMVTAIKYSQPVNTQQQGPGSGCATCPISGCGLFTTGLLGPPDQLHAIGPLPNRFPTATQQSIEATVQSELTGVPDAQVVFTSLLGNITFQNGTPVANGSTALTTDINGRVIASFVMNSAGMGLVGVRVSDSPISAYVLVTSF